MRHWTGDVALTALVTFSQACFLPETAFLFPTSVKMTSDAMSEKHFLCLSLSFFLKHVLKVDM